MLELMPTSYEKDLTDRIERTVFTDEEWSLLEEVSLEITKHGKRGNKNWRDYEFYKSKITRRDFSQQAYVESLRGIVYLLDL